MKKLQYGGHLYKEAKLPTVVPDFLTREVLKQARYVFGLVNFSEEDSTFFPLVKAHISANAELQKITKFYLDFGEGISAYPGDDMAEGPFDVKIG